MADKDHNFLVVIAGPTGIGKTNTSVSLAKTFQSEVVSFDSRQIYREMKIGTAFPKNDELNGVPHHMLGNKSIHEYYNASMYENEVIDLLDKLFHYRNIVFMAGGTGFYLDAVLKGIDELPTIDENIRAELYKKYEEEGIESIRFMLKHKDPYYYEKVDLHNPKRILKALEVCIMTGVPYSRQLSHPKKKRTFNPVLIGLNTDRSELYERINNRVENMIKQGLVEEAKMLHPYKELNALNTVGYKELFSYFEGKLTLEEAIDLIKRNTRKYARRQLTWFRRYDDMKWFQPNNLKGIIKHIEQQIQD